MKRVFKVAALVSIIIAAATTDSRALTWELGLKGGASLSLLTGSEVDSIGGDFKPGLAGSFWVKSGFAKHFGIRVEGTFVQKGSAETFVGKRTTQDATNTADFEVTNKLSYAEIPILLVASKWNETRSTRLGLYAGPAFAFNISADRDSISGGDTRETDIKDSVPSTDLGLMIGLESTFTIGDTSWLTFDMRWTLGLDEVFVGRDVHNSSFQIMMGIAFPLGYEGIIVAPPPLFE